MKSKLRKLIASLTSVCVLIAPTLSYADINNLLDGIVNGNNTFSTSYYQPPAMYKSPTNNILTLGSYSFRLNNHLMQTPILSFTPPQATLSCDGADFNTGWVSVLNFQDFSGILQDAGTALAWGIVLGLVYSLPGVADVFQKLNEWGSRIQGLAMNACTTGMKIGKTLGSEIFENNKIGAQDAAMSAGQTSTYEGTFESTLGSWQSDIINYNKLSKFFGDVPYGSLYEVGETDPDIDNLIASLFGVVEWKTIDPNTQHACADASCLSPNNVKVSYSPPLISNLDTIMTGGTLRLYQCNWGPNPYNGVPMCIGGVQKARYTLSQGLITDVAQKIDGIVSNMIQGNYQPDPNTAGWIASVPIPGFTDMLTYLAVLKNRGFTTQYQSALQGISEMVAALMLRSLVLSAQNTLTSVGHYLSEKDATADITQEEVNINKAAQWVNSYIDKNMKDNLSLIVMAEKTYKSLRAEAEYSFYEKFGKGAQLFMNNEQMR